MSNLSAQEILENDTPNLSGAKQILIAEDEPLVRGLLRSFLKLWGYRTLVAHDGQEALEVAAKHPEEIHLLLSDVTMPRMDGQQLAKELTKRRPELKVILISGYSHFQIVLRRGWEFIQKPFKPADMKETIERVL